MGFLRARPELVRAMREAIREISGEDCEMPKELAELMRR